VSWSAVRSLLGLAIGLLVTVCCARTAVAEFHLWVDADGQRRISNIAPHGIMNDGGVRKSFHPNSVVAQHARMRVILERQGAALAAAQAAMSPKTGSATGLYPVLTGSSALFRRTPDNPENGAAARPESTVRSGDTRNSVR
jgi:hypothetical protein